jgi:hypothetical protein
MLPALRQGRDRKHTTSLTWPCLKTWKHTISLTWPCRKAGNIQ